MSDGISTVAAAILYYFYQYLNGKQTVSSYIDSELSTANGESTELQGASLTRIQRGINPIKATCCLQQCTC